MMITPSDIQAAIVERLKEAFPGETVYEDLTPRNFTRPSNMVQLDAITPEQCGRNVIKLLFKYKISTFSEVDDIHNSHLPVLDFRAMMIALAFSGDGYLKVADRAPTVVGCVADTAAYDFAEVTLTLAQTYDRRELAPETVYSVMQDLALRMKKKEDPEE